MNSKLVLGIDGGQTTTIAALADATGNILGVGVGGPANHIHESGGVERVRQSLRTAIAEARSQAGVGSKPIDYAFLGMTGGSEEMENICRSSVDATQMELGHDSLIALTSVSLGSAGIGVIAGTGSAAMGRDPQHNEARSGGWGYLFGDEGSAYWIGVEALRAIGYALDGSIPDTTLLGAFLQHFQVESFDDIHRLIYSGSLARVEIAELAEVVSSQAVAGDQIAGSILNRAGLALARLPAAIIQNLNFGEGPIMVGTVGGVWKAGDFVLETFKMALQSTFPNVVVTPPLIPAASASVLLAIQKLEGELSPDVVFNLSQSSGLFPALKK